MKAPSKVTPSPSADSGHRWRSWLPRVLFESVLIVFSVLLALALDEWRENRQIRERVALAVEAVRSELQANRSRAQQAYAFHRDRHETLQALAAAGQLPSREIYLGGMFNPARVVSTAWVSARESGAVDQLPYALVLELSRVYESQAKYEALWEQIVADLYTEIRRHGAEPVLRDGFRGFIILTEDFANREAALLKQYERALAALRQVQR